MKRAILILSLAIILRAASLPESVEAQNDFLSMAAGYARASQRETGVPASVTIAQSIIETNWGRRPIGDANNYFGIKAYARSDGNVNVGRVAVGWVSAWTKEWDGSKFIDVQARFRKYRSMEDSFRDHGYVLAETDRYAPAMQYIDQPQEFARQITRAGWATAPSYDNDLIQAMDRLGLYQYDLKRDDAAFIGQSDFLNVHPGEMFQIYFDVRNVGYATWRKEDDYKLININQIRF